MASTYTGLGVQLMTTGEKAGTWGTLTNTNWNIMEQISGGYIEVDINGGAQTTTLSVNDGTAGAALAHRVIKFIGAITGNQIVTIPLDVQTFYIVDNATTGEFTVQFKYVSGSDSGVTWGTTDKGNKIIYAAADDGTNPVLVDTGFIAAVVDDTSPELGGNLDVNSNSIVSASNGNIPLAPNGTGEVLIGSGSAAGDLTSSGAYDLIIDTNTGTNAGNITLSNGANGDISFTNNGTGNVVFNDAAYNPATTLTDEATITWDAQAKPITAVTLTDNRTLAAPSNGQAGQFISLLVIQDAGGTNTLAWNAVFEFPSETAPTLTSTGDLADLFVFRYHNSKWLQVGSTLALTVA